jgi:hypothetical protein
MKTLVLYAFHIYNDRVHNFINNCVFEDKNIDFCIICNNKEIQFECPKYVKVIKRDNYGFDFGAWSYALLKDDYYLNYDTFICINSSVVGPYLHPNFQGKWTDVYLNGLQKYKLFGSTINTIEKPHTHAHVQSYIFSLNKETLEYLIKANIFSLTNLAKTMTDAIWLKEVQMSQIITNYGWNIGSLLKIYENVDFTKKSVQEYNIPILNDLMYSKYRNIHWNEYELIFVKGNRVRINDLESLVDNSRTDKNTRHKYLGLYEKLINRIKFSASNILEIGLGENNKICNGGSIKLWLDYFPNANVYGVEILPRDMYVNGWDKVWWNNLLNNKRININFSTNGYNKETVEMFESVKFDMILDDGPHTLESMINFIRLYVPLLTDNGILIIEDIKQLGWLEHLKNETPTELHSFIKTYDLRNENPSNPFKDDIVFVIDKKHFC